VKWFGGRGGEGVVNKEEGGVEEVVRRGERGSRGLGDMKGGMDGGRATGAKRERVGG